MAYIPKTSLIKATSWKSGFLHMSFQGEMPFSVLRLAYYPKDFCIVPQSYSMVFFSQNHLISKVREELKRSKIL